MKFWISKEVSVILSLCSLVSLTDAKKDKNANPPFFLVDSTDGMCFSGSGFKRCSIDTIFSAEGVAGSYLLKKHSAKEEEDDEQCVLKMDCDDSAKKSDVAVGPCTHCGANQWNILGDASTGYIVTEGDGKFCLSREGHLGSNAKLVPCDQSTDDAADGDDENSFLSLTYFNLNFVNQKDLEVMNSDAAVFVNLAESGDLEAMKEMLEKVGKDEAEKLINAKDFDNYTALHAAAFHNQADIVKFLLENGQNVIDVNDVDNDDITPLMKAAIRGHTEVVKILVEMGADITHAAKNDVTAAFLAAGEGRVETLEYLISRGADVQVKRNDGTTPLMNACTGTGPGQLEVIKLLLEDYDKEWINLVDTNAGGLTALMRLCDTPSDKILESIKLLVSKGADVNVPSGEGGFTALMMAAANGYVDTVKYLLAEGADANIITTGDKSTALMYAGAAGHSKVVDVLIKDGNADVNVKHNGGGTALTESAASGNAAEVIDLLLDAGAEVNVADDNGITALMMAASAGDIETSKKLIEKNKDSVEQTSESGGFALLYAASAGHSALVETLLKEGADVRKVVEASPAFLENLAQEGVTDNSGSEVNGMNVLHVAAQSGYTRVIQSIVDNSDTSAIADIINAQDSEGRTPLILSVKNNFGGAATKLLENGADPNVTYQSEDDDESSQSKTHNLLMDALIVENEEFAKLLISKGADLTYVDTEGGNVTLLLQASHRGLFDVVKAIVEDSKFDKSVIETANSEGVTPLLAAASEGHKEVFDYLITNGANANHVEKDGTSVLAAAAARGHLDVVISALKVKGIDINTQNSDGHTALMFAYNGKNQVASLWERYQQFVIEQADDISGSSAGSGDDATKGKIKDALEQHEKLIKALISAGADESLKDKDGHVAKDFDYVEEADLNAEVLEAERKKKSKKGTKDEL